MVLSTVVLALNLLVFGAHARLPLLAAGGEAGVGRAWRRLALPALGLSVVATLVAVRIRPDAAISWGMVGPGSGRLRLLALALVAVALCDLLVALGGERIGPAEWRIAAAFGAGGLVAWTLGSELLRIGSGPVPPRVAFLLAAALRLPLGLAAGEVAAGRPRWGSVLAGPCLVGAFLLWPAALRAPLGGDLPTLLAAAVLLSGARFLPGRLGRWAGGAGLALAALFLARSGSVSGQLGGAEQLPVDLLLGE